MNVKIMSRTEIEEFIEDGYLSGIDVISFRDVEDTSMIDFEEFPGRVFSVAVDDLEYDELKEYGLTIDTYFPEAEEVAKFIREAIASNKDIICQCEYGQGRSAGCAAAILEALYGSGISIFSDYHYFPNKIIYNKLVDKIW